MDILIELEDSRELEPGKEDCASVCEGRCKPDEAMEGNDALCATGVLFHGSD